MMLIEKVKMFGVPMPPIDAAAVALQKRCDAYFAKKPGWKTIVCESTGNGGKPIAVLIPPGFQASKPAKVQMHYHGDGTAAVEKNNEAMWAIEELCKADPQRVFIMPEA